MEKKEFFNLLSRGLDYADDFYIVVREGTILDKNSDSFSLELNTGERYDLYQDGGRYLGVMYLYGEFIRQYELDEEYYSSILTAAIETSKAKSAKIIYH
jgi:hypothetical protein